MNDASLTDEEVRNTFFKKNWDSLHAMLNSHYKAWSHKKRSTKKITGYRKSVQKEPRCLLILDLKPLRSTQVKGKHPIDSACICFDFVNQHACMQIWQAKSKANIIRVKPNPASAMTKVWGGESQNIIQIQKMKIRNDIQKSQPF